MGGDGLGGQYRWDLMPNSPLATSTEFERQAIGRLMHDTRLSIGMDYGPTASSANTLDTRTALVDTFGFAGASSAHSGGANIPGAIWRQQAPLTPEFPKQHDPNRKVEPRHQDQDHQPLHQRQPAEHAPALSGLTHLRIVSDGHISLPPPPPWPGDAVSGTRRAPSAPLRPTRPK